MCVPNAVERATDLAGAIQKLKVNWTYLTPVLARRLLPSMIPTIETICFRTRRLDPDTLARWSDKTRVLLSYGAADICPFCISVTEISDQKQLSRIAPPFVGTFWISHSDTHNQIGELVVEGPTLAHKLTSKSTPREALLAASMNSYFPCSRFLRTGHQVQYNAADTSMKFITSCRDDVTVNGNTIPVSTVEQHIRRCMGTQSEVVVECVTAKDGINILAAFIELGSNFEGDEDLTSLSATTKERIFIVKKLVDSLLQTMLPSYMLPVTFIPLRAVPLTSSLKVHRQKLLKMARNLSISSLLNLSVIIRPTVIRTPTVKPLPIAHVEKEMRRIWGRLLNIDPSTITGTQSFFRLEGSAHLVGDLVVECQKEGLALPVRAVFENASFTTLCQSIVMAQEALVPISVEAPFPTRVATGRGTPTGSNFDFAPKKAVRCRFSTGGSSNKQTSKIFRRASVAFGQARKVFRRMSRILFSKPKTAF